MVQEQSVWEVYLHSIMRAALRPGRRRLLEACMDACNDQCSQTYPEVLKTVSGCYLLGIMNSKCLFTMCVGGVAFWAVRDPEICLVLSTSMPVLRAKIDFLYLLCRYPTKSIVNAAGHSSMQDVSVWQHPWLQALSLLFP